MLKGTIIDCLGPERSAAVASRGKWCGCLSGTSHGNHDVTMRIVIAVQILVTIIVCPKSCALKKAGCKNQVFEEYRQLRDKRFFAKSSEDKGTGQNEFIIPYNGEIIISIPELQIRIQGKW
ncbi:hypothetical protein L3Y34_005432 [Caenorhabditis briggsae]|uniref:Uncharacterized protein n=1 Tax=Caenorhabditis briggsae TaxID=6238 RepID=A0AAE9AEP3_CAEBR|nr:hypothetical protein L3Y34_005432 [Caenorhabditis briggsae]